MADEFIVRSNYPIKPIKKFPTKAASTATSEELLKEVNSLIVDVKTMLDDDLVLKPAAG